jgi:hypothetical protein
VGEQLDLVPPMARALMNLQDRAHRRLLGALAELARIQKLVGQSGSTTNDAVGSESGRSGRALPGLRLFGG